MKTNALPIIISLSAIFFLPSPTRSKPPAPPPIAQIEIENSHGANVARGDRIPVGQIIQTAKNGQVEGNVNSFGVSFFRLSGLSMLSIRDYGFAFGGARTLTLALKGEAYIRTRPSTHRESWVRVCLKGKGCAKLNSGVKFRELADGRSVVGVREGRAIGQDVDEKLPPVEISARQFSIVNTDGRFSPPQKVGKSQGYRIFSQSKTVINAQASEGYRLQYGNTIGDAIQIPKGLLFKVLSPLD